jgi:type III pantothenate kinase
LGRIARPEGVIVASVVPSLDARLAKALLGTFGRRPLFLTHRNAGVKVRLRRPAEAGADRLANALAAREIHGAPCVVVDYGTGTTFDVVDAKGSYRGGAILPGPGTSLRSLREFTAKIPLVRFAKARRAVGRGTVEAVQSGVYFGAVGATREILSRVRKELGRKAPAVATGGWCRAFAGTGLFDAVDPDLTLKGLELAWKRNKKNV